MGNSLGRKKTIKVMKIDGETLKLKAPVKAGELLKDYPGLVLLESEAVKHFGVRAKPLEADKELEPKRLYFLVELPKGSVPPRRVRSGINMSAKDRLENLMLTRRSASDLSIMKQSSNLGAQKEAKPEEEGSEKKNGGVKLKIKLPKAEVERLINESKDEAEAAERIMGLYMAATSTSRSRGSEDEAEENGEKRMVAVKEQKQVHGKGGGRGRFGESTKARGKRVSFMPIAQGGRQIAVAS